MSEQPWGWWIAFAAVAVATDIDWNTRRNPNLLTFPLALAGTGGEPDREWVALRTAHETLDRAERTLASIEKTAGRRDETRITASETLEELERTLRALRNLADCIQTHPEAVVLGKEKGKEK